VGVPVAVHLATPVDPAQAIEHRLARGEDVLLIGETGSPPYVRWAFQEGGILNREVPGMPFSFHTFTTSLLELVADPQQPRYRFSAEVRHDANDGGEVGIFFAYSKHDPGKESHHCFLELSFLDRAPGPAGGRAGRTRPNEVRLSIRDCGQRKVDDGRDEDW